MEFIELMFIAVISWIIFKKLKEFVSNRKATPRVEEWHDLGLIRHRYESQALNSGFVYFVKEEGNNQIKIGRSIHPETRVKNNFGTIMPHDHKIIHKINSANHSKTEKLFHKYFDEKRSKGEWFHLSDKDIEWVKKGRFPRDIDDSIKGY